MTKLWTTTYTFYVDVNLHMQYILVMRNKRLINKWILLWYVDVLVSVSPFKKSPELLRWQTSTPTPTYLFKSQFLPTCIQEGTWVWLNAFCKVWAISRPFMIFLYDYSPLDGMVFQDLLSPLPPWGDGISRPFMTKSVCPNPCSPQHTHTCAYNHRSHIT